MFWFCVYMVVLLVFVCMGVMSTAKSYIFSFLLSFCIYLILLFFGLLVLYICAIRGLSVDQYCVFRDWF